MKPPLCPFIRIASSSPALLSFVTFKSKTLLQSLKPFSSTSSQAPKWNSNTSVIITHPTLLVLESCSTMSELKQIQAQMTRTGLIFHIFPLSRVLSFCALAECGDISYAHLIFIQIKEPNTYMWNTIIRGYSKMKNPLMGFSLFRQMIRKCVDMDKRSFVFVLKVCEQFLRILEGESVHCTIYKMDFASDLLVRNGLIHFYAKNGFMGFARQVFDENSLRDVVSWTTMIDGYAKKSFSDEALTLFDLMLSSGVKPNEVTMITVLSACSRKGILSLGVSIHEYIKNNNVNCSLNLMNAILDMYVKCGCLTSARVIFDKMDKKDVFSWTSMINGHAKHGDLVIAKEMFDEMPHRNVVSWNAMIAGYSQNNQPKEALELFGDMVKAGLVPIESTLVCVLSACGQSGCLDLGQWIHHYYVNQKRIQQSMTLANSLIDMYAKCGSIVAAEEIFDSIAERDLVSWNALIVGYATHGHAEKAVALFEHMKSVGLKPDDITFVGVLSACSHGGMVTEGWKYFRSMGTSSGLKPKVEHYACMIDLLGRIGRLEEAYKLIASMPMDPDKAAWGALLNACKMHGNVELGKLAAIKLQQLDPDDSGIYVLLATLCANQRRWDDVRMVRSAMRGRGIKKTPGCSLIEVGGEFHEFVVADESHPLAQEIYRVLDELWLLSGLEEHVSPSGTDLY